MEKLKNFLKLRSIISKIVLAIVVSMLVLIAATGYLVRDGMDELETTLINDRLNTELNYVNDLSGSGDWQIVDGMLCHGMRKIGDGTEEHANLDPFLMSEVKTGSFSYAFMKTSDEGLTWVGDKKTGYQQGHYLRVAGSTRNPDGSSLVGTYLEKKVADALDTEGEYSGAVNINGSTIYCYYRVLKSKDGEIVGAIVTGRSVEEMSRQYSGAMWRVIRTTLIVFLLIAAGLIVILSRWLNSINRIKGYLKVIGSGFFPEQPLMLRSNDEIAEVANSINEMTESLKEKERIGAELSIATDIQANMLPCIFPPFPEHNEFDVYATMNPAKEVGGDFYDFFMVDDKHLAVVIADVSGKGVPAALFMVITKTLIKNHAQMYLQPSEVFNTVNETLCEGNEAGLFVTAWMGILDIENGKLTYVNAGHNPPMIKLADGGYRMLKSRPGFVLAGMDTVRYRQNELQMNPGDRLFLYTDGVTEAMNKENQLYGDDRMAAYLNAHQEEPLQDVLHGLRTDIDSFVDGAEQFDDITMLILDYRRKGEDRKMLRKEFDADDAALSDVMAFVEEELDKADCPMKTTMQITVAVEEMFVNIAHYAYQGNPGRMQLGICTENGKVTIELTDSGVPFNPLAKNDPDITLSAEDRAIGGLGIFMVKKSMDEVSYVRRDDKNVFTMAKKIG